MAHISKLKLETILQDYVHTLFPVNLPCKTDKLTHIYIIVLGVNPLGRNRNLNIINK